MLFQVVALSGAEEEETFSSRLVNSYIRLSNHLEGISGYNDGRLFVDADADEFRRGLDEGVQVVLPVAGEDVLVDG